MVKHGRNKKRRAGRSGHTKLKNRNYSKFKPPQFCDATVRANWDPTKSATVNMAKIGLQENVNSDRTYTDADSEPSASSRGVAVEVFDVPESDVIPKKTKSLRMLPVSTADQRYVVRLLERHGEDYKAMERDIKLNDMQHTETKLRRICSRFLLLDEGQIVVDMPGTVKDLLRR